MEMPGLKTRTKNKDTRPGVNAGVDKKYRRTAAQMQQACQDETTAKARATLEQRKALKRIAAIEDKQQQVDIAYAETANQPADHPLKPSTPEAATEIEKEEGASGAGADSGSGNDSEPYERDGDESSEESDSDADESDEDNVPKKKKKKPATTRADITASRTTQDSTGTPAVPPTENNAKKRKAKDDKASKTKKRSKSDKAKKKKSGLVESKALRNRGAPVASGTEPEDESMVAPGGPALDDDAEEHVEAEDGQEEKGNPHRRKPRFSDRIGSADAPTRALHNGAAKWTLRDLPHGTSTEFTEEVVPLARELVGTLHPWAGLTVKQIQEIIDRVYGAGKHLVTADSAWVGLVHRLSLERLALGIAMQATKAIQTLIDMYEDEDAESGPESEEVTAAILPVDDEGPVPAANPVPKVLKFTFDTPEGIAAFVEWALQPHDESGTMAFHWKTWGNGIDKKIERALQFWKTGEYMNPQKPSSHFSVNNWGDTTIRIHNRDKQVKGKWYDQWDQARWDELKEAVSEWVETPTRKRAASSRSASEAGDDLMMSDDDEVIVMSD
ncbi:hypothetical protein B0H10DRAFT_1938273 [Mycena sp. CBHHK59/15]|nr:hypothetical protein B0H10DRAFT_1938273 [Mycena sp. CBHHK59/15]